MNMTDQELLRDLTESYLKSVISEASGSLNADFDSSASFGELGIDSFRVLKIIKRLEADFGRLPKSLLFENFNVTDLTGYFTRQHERTLSIRFKDRLQGANGALQTNGVIHTNGHSNGRHTKPAEISAEAKLPPGKPVRTVAKPKEPVCMLEKEAYEHPEFRDLIQGLFDRHSIEGSISRGTRKIAPNLFIGSARRGYFNYGRSKDILLVYAYTGPRDYLPELREEMYRYCNAKKFQFNFFGEEEAPSIGDKRCSATPFGVLQRISNLKEFAIDGGAMRRLRYQVFKFQKCGLCKTQEYRCGTNPQTDKDIARVIDQWCASRTMVNPLVYDFKDEVLAGELGPRHRLFLTYLDDVLQNAILLTAMSAEENGYLMDLEFYPPDMPLGGLEFAIVQIIETLAGEGRTVLSLGGTYGCKLGAAANADPEMDKILDDLREKGIFNDAGNLQFKNKFRPENKAIYLCRPEGSANPDNVIDIIMMIADPEKMQTPDVENVNTPVTIHAPAASIQSPLTHAPATPEQALPGNHERSRILWESGFNPLNIPPEHIEFDLQTDSWSQLQMPSIEEQMKQLHAKLQQPSNLEENLKAVFPFSHFVLTASGREAEHVLFKAWPSQGTILQNLLFPSSIFNEIDKGFTIEELPHPAVFDLNSREQFKGNMDWKALQSRIAQAPGSIALACIEVANNAAGGSPVSMQHLRDVKALLAKHGIPLLIDGTRILENSQLLIEQDKECAGKDVWAVTRETFALADAVFASLTKDFCVPKGGIIATNDSKLFQRFEELAGAEGIGVDLIDKKIIALSLENRKQIEAKTLRRMEANRLIWKALKEHKIPVAEPAGGHCVLIDVKQIAEFKNFSCPAASFVAWLYLNTGIRAAGHSVGMQKGTTVNELVRLAIPVGLTKDEAGQLTDRLISAFNQKVNIPEIVMENGASQRSGDVYAHYQLLNYHNPAESTTTITVPGKDVVQTQAHAAESALPPTVTTKNSSDSQEMPAAGELLKPSDVPQANGSTKRRVQDVAIVGMAGRYPKAKNVRELWENLVQGRDCIEEIPPDRYEWRLRHGSVKKYRGGFIDDIDKFDSLFFNISPREAEMLDPQERLFLEVAWEAIEDAGYYPEILAQEDGSRNIGVFVGAVWAMYQMLGVEEKHAGNTVIPNSFLWSIANRVSYWFNLSGPSLTLDTACSSSLTAIYLACEAIQAGECSAAIVGGVNLDLHQTKFDINWAGGALSPDGVCRTFGNGANGYAAGEGVGAIFLKPLDRAVQDGDNIYGVIKSAVVNHGGRTTGYTVPNPKAQSNLVISALEKAKVGAQSIGYVEAHGTGTELGDPIEISGLSSAFSADDVKNQSCAIGSVKSNIGHLEAAAGVVGICKVLLQMKHRQLVPSLHSAELNQFIDFQNSPFYVVQNAEEWKSREADGVQLPLRAGISSFGAGGANAHIILESYEPRQENKEEDQGRPLIFPLSARNEDQLRETAARLAQFLRQNSVDLIDTAYTLQMGRKSFDHRLAVVARTKEELIEKLGCFIDGKKIEDIVAGHAKNADNITRLLDRREKEEFIRMLAQSRDPRRLAELWVEGILADWHGSQSQTPGKRTSLPTYPFADKRHWAGERTPVQRAVQPAVGMHLLVDTNESTFERQLFKKVFSERDFFIYDHIVANIPTLPGVAYLEFARKAGELAAGRKVQKIKNILWVSPIAVQNSTPKEVFIELKPSKETVRFEVFSNDAQGNKVLHSQGTLLYSTQQQAAAEPEYIDLEGIRKRCTKAIDAKSAYPLFKSFGLSLGPSFQVLQQVHKNADETIALLELPEFRRADLQSMVLHPSLVDGSLQAGVSAHLGDKTGEMVVPFSIGEVEILHPLPSKCFSYVTEAKEGKKEGTRVAKSNVLIVDERGKILVKIHESTGVPLRELYKKEDEGFSKLYYAYSWEKAAATGRTEAGSIKSLLLFDVDETLHDLFQERLRKTGASPEQIILVQPGESFEEAGKQLYKVNPRSKDDFVRLFERLVERNCSIENICFAWAARPIALRDEQTLREFLEKGVCAFLSICQALVKQKLESKTQLLYLYSTQAQPQAHNDAMRGFVNALRLEHSKLLCKTLEVRQESADHEQILNALTAELELRSQDANAVRYVEQERSIKKLKTFDIDDATGAPACEAASLKEKGVYLITGGAGGLGLIFAEFLAKEYKARLVLTGRSKLPAEKEAKLDELRKTGAEILYLTADVCRAEDVRSLISETRSRFGEIHGIIHAAGVLRDSLVRNKTTEEMRAVFAPKVHGTIYLDEATRNDKLDFFVTFSSLAAVAGNAGQCDYSFANHFMDAFAEEREHLRVQGERYGKTLSINWSIWADGGMKLDEQTALFFRKNLGINPISAEAGVEAFVKGLASEKSQFAMLEGMQEKVELAWGLRKKKVDPPVAAPTVPASQSPFAPDQQGDLCGLVENELTKIVMEFLKLGADDIATDKILLDLGFDSIGLTTFANSVNDKFQLDITPVLFFDYPTIGEIAKYLSAERASEIRRFYQGSAAPSAPATSQPPTAGVAAQQEVTLEIRKGWDPAALDQGTTAQVHSGDFSPELRFMNMPIAIVGMSGVMPQSDDLNEFWENLKNSKDMISVIPPDRWRWEDYYGDPLKEVNKSNSKWGGFMREIDKFDPLFFGISPREAETMDPQQRLFLETVWKAIEDSGQKVSDLSGTRTGLFVGVATNDYIDVMKRLNVALDAYSASGNSHSVLANRVSFLLNLHGPSAPIDTACSSSLIALHRAIESIHSGSCDMAIVGGVQVMLSPAAYISFSMAGMLSGDGKCKTFDKQANGYVRGEGCGAIFLKPLAKAEADGNHIYAVIRATAENHGGKVTTLTAPNSTAQAALLVEAYEKAHIDPATVGYIECHGTGTSLGDPIEIQALGKAFSELYKKRNKAPAQTPHCGLSSVKTNIGHLETAAGIASLLKALLSIKHKQIAANLHFEELNPYINLKGTPFYIADKLTTWEAPKNENGSSLPRRAGVSSFGFGGANAHIVLEEYVSPAQTHPVQAVGPQLIVLSAKNDDRLKAYMQSMLAFFEKGEIELADLAYTLQVGRDEMPERLALVVASVEDLKQKLTDVLKNGGKPNGIYLNRVKKSDAAQASDTEIITLAEQRELSRLAELWVSGAKIDWRLLYKSGTPRRIPAPTYPFARERYWIQGVEAKPVERQEIISKAAGQAANKRAPQVDKSRSAAISAQTDAGLQSLVPVWNPVYFDAGKKVVLPEITRIVLLGSDQASLDWVRTFYPNSQLLEFSSGESIDSIEKKLADCAFDQLLWVAPDANPATAYESESIIDRQEQGVLIVFRTIKALLRLGHEKKKLQWTFVTCRTQHVADIDVIQPAHAGIVGLVGSLAKEYLQWDLRLLDVDSITSVPAQECLSLPWDSKGNALAHRRGEWLQQGLAFCGPLPVAKPAYRENGVYVVIGGAGGLGEVWTRFMMEHYQANVVWIGRRKYDAAIEDKINSLTMMGHAPLYISADATNVNELREACETILKTYPAIHGVVHSAIVAHDQSLARMEEPAFRASLAAKVDVSVNMDRVFGDQALDFMLFFSSTVSFFKSPGQSHYSAGCLFKDSFAHSLEQQRSYPVRTMNWCYWGGVGVVADESYNKLMAQMGIGSIEPQEGMSSLQALVNSDVPQMVLIKTLNSLALAGLNLSDTIAYHPKAEPSALPGIDETLSTRLALKSTADLEQEVPKLEMNELVTEILVSSLTTVGLFRNGIHFIADLQLEKPPARYFERWLSTSIRYLQQQKWLDENLAFTRQARALADLWVEWGTKTSGWATNPAVQAQIALLEACLKGLPGILGGRHRATDIMFPNSSMHLVEGIYRGNVLADYFNDVLSKTLIACIEQQLQSGKKREIRILEVGAGTGGTTAKLLPMLKQFPIAEYCYTDVSKAFLMHAEKQYQPEFPALTTAIFDVSKPLAQQSIALNRYDFVIAANVLHATPSIREALRNAKAALKNHGVLLLNEISAWSLSIHLTFGLLEGWWLYEDAAVRMGGNPGLLPEKWREILAEEGFEAAAFPAEEAHKFGQQIVAACSNGWTRQSIVKASPAQRSAAEPTSVKAAGAAGTKTEQSNKASRRAGVAQTARDRIRKIINGKLSMALRIDADKIRPDTPFADYGVDSIIGVNLVRTMNEELGIELEPAKLFEYSTVDELTEHIWADWQEQISGQCAEVSTDETPLSSGADSEHDSGSKDSLAEEHHAFDFNEIPAARAAVIHPLLHTNTSTFSQQSYSSTLTGEEFFLKDCQKLTQDNVRQKVLPEAAYLEMARAAIEAAAGINQGYSVVELQETIWGDPMAVSAKTQVTIALLPNDNDTIHYEIYSGEQERIHCQGQISITHQLAPAPLDVDELHRQMHGGKLAPDHIYAALAKAGRYYGPDAQTLTAIHHGEGQLLARLSLSPSATTNGASGWSSYLLHPRLMTGAMHAGIWLVAKDNGTGLLPHTLQHLRVLAPCKRDMFAWARNSQDGLSEGKGSKLDIDLIDTQGNVCVQMRGLIFREDETATEHAAIRWLFTREPNSFADTGQIVAMEARAKAESFLKQEIAIQLNKPFHAIPVDHNYFDLGLSSPAITRLIQEINRLLGENLSPTILFDYRDIESLAAYLAFTYPSKINALTVIKQERGQRNSPALAPLPRKKYFAERLAHPSSEGLNGRTAKSEINTQILTKVLWQEEVLDETYEKVTF
jgi:acyl transferase domain-containing protein/tryptophanase/SAM-dependent methyltransferase